MAYKLGLTGGIGSGKSTVAQMLSDCGAAVIDADALSRSLTAPQGEAIAAIAEQFGADFIASDGSLDRDRMRERVYDDETARRRLEAIIHPLVARLSAQLEQRARSSGCRCLVFDIPLLVESARRRAELDAVMVVDCREATQIERVVQRSALAPQAVQKILATQATREQRLKAADIVLFNDRNTLAQLRAEVGAAALHFGL